MAMNKMAMKSMKDLREIAEAALATGVANREQLRSAVPALVALQSAAKSMQRRINETRDVIEALSEACSAYAHRHPEYVFNQSFSVSPIGVESGDLEVDGKTYHFAYGFDGYERAEQGQKMTQDFLATLPEGWTKPKLELDKSAVNRAKPTEDDLAEVGLVRKVKQTWTELP